MTDRGRERRISFRDPLEIRTDAEFLEELRLAKRSAIVRPAARAAMHLAEQLTGAGSSRKVDAAGKEVELPVAQARIDQLHSEPMLFRVGP